MRRWQITFALLAALLAARCFAWAETPPDGAEVIAPGSMVEVSLEGGPRTFSFTPPSGSVYDVCVFPTEAGAGLTRAALWQGGELLAEGEGGLTPLSQRLSAQTPCVVLLEGRGRVRVEVARHALSRCFEVPMTLDAGGDRYAKAIARAGDAHWYALTPDTGQPVALAGIPAEEGLSLEARLFDASGTLLAEAARTTGGAFLMDFAPVPGQTYRVRVSSPNREVGAYDLRLLRCEGGVPEAVTLSHTAVRLNGRESLRLSATVNPEGAEDVLYWESSDSRVVRVDASGELTGYMPGAAVVTAYAAGSVKARCRVEVARVAAEGVALVSDRIALNVGDDAALEWHMVPENASDPRVRFSVAPRGIVEVDGTGVLSAVGEGEAEIVLRALDGGFEARVAVTVAPAQKRYRALLVGEQRYAATVASERLGSANSVAGLRSMLKELSYGGSRFEVFTRLDATRDGVLRAIRECFDGAADQDVSLFYITCHGYYAHGMTHFQMYDGSVLTAAELRQALNRVPGEIVALVDCCGSGGVIGRAGSTADILKGVAEVFEGTLGPSELAGSRFRVLASATVEQDSYRVSFSTSGAESGMATTFARAICEGAGWSIDRSARAAMRADVNYDNVVTLDELYNYVSRRVMWYLSLSGGDYAQTVQASPEGDIYAVFERS